MSSSLRTIKTHIIDSAIFTTALLSVPVLAVSVWRSVDFGWNLVFTVQFILAVCLFFLSVFRNSLHFHFKTFGLVFIYVVILFSSRFLLGVTGPGLSELLIVVLLTYVYSWRHGLFSFLVLVAINTGFAFHYVDGSMHPIIYTAHYNALPSSWVVHIFGILFFAGTIATMVFTSNNALEEMMEQLREKNQVLNAENRELEQNLELLPVPIAVSHHGRVVFLNMAFTRMFGWSTLEIASLTDWQHRAFGSFFSPQNKYFGWAPDHTSTHNAFLLKVNDNTERYVVITPKKRGEKVLVTFEDLSSWVHAEKLLRQSEEKLMEQNSQLEQQFLLIQEQHVQVSDALERAEQGDMLKNAFLANLSHEIRTPMNGIIGFADMIASMELNAAQYQRYGQIISNSSNQLLNTLTDIIDISKIESKQVEVFRRDCEVRAILEAVYDQYQPIAQSKRIGLINSSSAAEYSYINTDPSRLRQVVENLVNNAIKFTNQGHVEIGFRSTEQWLSIFVRDTGQGISPECHSTIFDRFYQVENEVSKRSGGVGLGLTIAKAFVEMLGGHINLSSQLGQGSEFTVVLPFDFEAEKLAAQLVEIPNKEEIF